MDSSPVRRVLDVNNAAAGVKRPAPGSLLPAFEPSSSPPCFKRHKSRVSESENRYPTPVPSSSLGILSSPPPQLSCKPVPEHSQPALSERSPLGGIPSITLPDNGEPLLLGRSSNSSHYQLSANRLISRVHVKALYLTTASRPKVEIQCLGWNGVKVHCQGHAWELEKGDVFTSETEHAEIMLDVQDSRVVLAWPGRSRSASLPALGSPTGRISRSPSIGWVDDNDENVDPCGSARNSIRRCSAMLGEKRNRSPVSPLHKRGGGNSSSMLLAESQMTDTFLEIYEDEPVPDFKEGARSALLEPSEKEEIAQAMRSLLGDSEGEDEDDDQDGDSFEDDTDAIAQSFREEEPSLPPMITFSTAEPLGVPATPPTSYVARGSSAFSSPIKRRSASVSPTKANTLQNHITNQLAFSRLSSTPLSALLSNLPSSLVPLVNKERLIEVLDSLPCIGEIKRSGKDAAGKPLESEYYYVPDRDTDLGRRDAVVQGMGRVGLRACRRTHKQYYWRKPKKPAYY
ncbi:hypothetical protein C7212DRAFT_346518 [Tuber magnatum]|uniref:FHA domain-containing protein n=1 Tax=Tuber magnatum TaxID=42249 RepID=A0A317SKC3_9PEZI|nr:hypothetical protein C7212DRAFT_346518 [Tuber magnatum]